MPPVMARAEHLRHGRLREVIPAGASDVQAHEEFVGLDRTDPTAVSVLSLAVATAARRIDCVASGLAPGGRNGATPIHTRWRGVAPQLLRRIDTSIGRVEDVVECVERLRRQASWPAEGTSALLCIRDALRAVAVRVATIDAPVHGAANEQTARVMLVQARGRIRYAHQTAARLEDPAIAAEQSVHLDTLRRLIRTCSDLARATELAIYQRR
jgi:hypothetical protein